MTAARKMPRRDPEITTATGLEAAMRRHGTQPIAHDAPLAVVLASAHGIGDVDPIENLLADIRHLSGSLIWLLGHALEELDGEGYGFKVADHAWHAVSMIEKRAEAADVLRVRLRTEHDQGRSAPPESETRPRCRHQAGADVEPLRDVERDPESGEVERHLERCLELARLDAEEVNRTMGSCSPHYAQIARLVHSLSTMLRDASDAARMGPLAAKIGEAADVLEFELAEWRAQRSNAADTPTESPYAEEQWQRRSGHTRSRGASTAALSARDPSPIHSSIRTPRTRPRSERCASHM